MNASSRLAVPVFIKYVVVAFYKIDLQQRKILSPINKEVKFFVNIAMGEVTHYDQSFGFIQIKLTHQPLKIGLVNILRYRYSRFPKVTALAQMKVSDDKCILFLPK